MTDPEVVIVKSVGLTRGSIRRLARRAGVKRFSGLVVEEIRASAKMFLSDIIKDAVSYAEYNKCRTLKTDHVLAACRKRGRIIYM